MSEIVFLNDKFIPREEAKLPVFTPGFLYGWGLFESMRSYNKKIVYFDAHIERLKKSSRLLNIRYPYSSLELKGIILRAVTINALSDAYIRLTIWKCEKGTDTLVTAIKYRPYSLQKYKKGFCASVSSFRQNENSILANLKTTNYLLFKLACLQVRKKGYDEAVILNQRGYITEASRSNLFFIKGRELFTPSLECGCLDGITRRVVFDLTKRYSIEVFEGNLSLPDLYSADEAFLTNSLMGIMPLASIDQRKIGKGPSYFRLTRLLRERYKSLLENEVSKDKTPL